jgi:hypothetical protein
MVRTAHGHSDPTKETHGPTQRKRRRQQHSRHIRSMTREQQLALIEEARAARRVTQQATVATEAYAPTMERDQAWAYGNGWGKVGAGLWPTHWSDRIGCFAPRRVTLLR